MSDRIPLDDLTSDALDQLYDRLDFTEAALERVRDKLEVQVVRVTRRAEQAEAEVLRLTAGQCLDSRRMCEQHHTPPVTGCPYPQCVAARKQQETEWAEPHLFEQNPAAETVRVCRCGKWPDHHSHTGSTIACGCDTCRATEETDHA